MPETMPGPNFRCSGEHRRIAPDRYVTRLDVMGMAINRLDGASAAKSGMEQQAGLIVAAVRPGSMADLAGVASGDIVCEVAGIPVMEPAELERVLGEQEPRGPVSMLFRRVGGWRLLVMPPAECSPWGP